MTLGMRGRPCGLLRLPFLLTSPGATQRARNQPQKPDEDDPDDDGLHSGPDCNAVFTAGLMRDCWLDKRLWETLSRRVCDSLRAPLFLPDALRFQERDIPDRTHLVLFLAVIRLEL